MLFTRLGYVVAWLALVIGVFVVGSAASPLFTRGIEQIWSASEVLDIRMMLRGTAIAFLGIALGVLTEIHRSMKGFHDSIARWPT